MSIIHEPIIDENEDELLLACGDDLEPIEEIVEYIDDDYVLYFSNEEAQVQIIDILSFDDPHPEKRKWLWNKRASLYGKLLQPKVCMNPYLVPVIRGKDICIIKKEQEKLLQDKTNEDETKAYKTMRDVLQERHHLLKSREMDLAIVRKMKHQERLWTTNMATDMNVEKDTYAFSQSHKSLYLFKDDRVHVLGYGYIRPEINTTVVFDTQKYIDFIKTLKKDDDIILFFNDTGRKILGKVFYIKEDKYVFLHKLKQYTLYLDKIHEAEFFLSNPDRKKFNTEYCKHALRQKNVLFTLLPNDTDGKRTLQMFLPSMTHLVNYEKDRIIFNRYLFDKILRDEYGLCDDMKSYIETLNEVVQKHIQGFLKKELQRTSKPVPKKRFMSEFSSPYHLLDFQHFSLRYPFRNNFQDTEYNRMKYIHSLYDYGASYYSKVFLEELDIYYKYASNRRQAIGRELQKLNVLLDKKAASFAKCEPNIPSVKRTYKSLHELERDNFVDIPDVSIGDYALLDIEGTTKKYYKRHIIEKNKNVLSVWIYDRDMSFNMCKTNDKNDKNDKKERLCTFDKADDVCKDKDYYRLQNRMHHLEMKKMLIENLQVFLSSFEEIKSRMARDSETVERLFLQNKLSLFSSSLTFDDKRDYSDFIGIEDDAYVHFDEVDGNSFYSSLSVEEVSKKKGDTHMVEKFTALSGFDIPNDDVLFMIKMFDHRFPDTFQARLRQREKDLDNEIQAMLKKLKKDQAKQLEGMNKKDKSAIEQKKQEHKRVIAKNKQKFEEMKRVDLDKFSTLEKEERNIAMVAFLIASLTIFIQKNIPDVRVVAPSVACAKLFSFEGLPMNDNEKSLIKYLICLFKEKLSENSLTHAALMSSKLYKTIVKEIENILEPRQFLLEIIKSNSLKFEDYKKQSQNAVSEYPWETFKPNYRTTLTQMRNVIPYFASCFVSELLKKSYHQVHPLTNISNGFMHVLFDLEKDLAKIYRQIKSDVSVRTSTNASVLLRRSQDEPTSDLFLDKPIELTAYKRLRNKSMTRSHSNHVMTRYSYFIKPWENSDYWAELPNVLAERLNKLFETLNMDLNLYREMERLLFSMGDQTLKIKNAYACILEGDVRSDFGKIARNWDVNDDWVEQFKYMKKRRPEKQRIISIMNKREDFIKMVKKVHENEAYATHLRTIDIHVPDMLETLDTTNQHVQDMVMIYNYIFIEFLYKLVKSSFDDIEKDLYDLGGLNENDNPLAKRLIVYMCEMVTGKLKENIYDSLYLSRVNEQLRETSKEEIIRGLDQLTEEERKAFLQMQKKGMATWKDIPTSFGTFNVDVADENHDDL